MSSFFFLFLSFSHPWLVCSVYIYFFFLKDNCVRVRHYFRIVCVVAFDLCLPDDESLTEIRGDRKLIEMALERQLVAQPAPGAEVLGTLFLVRNCRSQQPGFQRWHAIA